LRPEGGKEQQQLKDHEKQFLLDLNPKCTMIMVMMLVMVMVV
jgi:hypothetical protein